LEALSRHAPLPLLFRGFQAITGRDKPVCTGDISTPGGRSPRSPYLISCRLCGAPGSPVFPMEDANTTREVAHCQRSHPLSAAPQTEHGVKAGSPMPSSTRPTGSPSVELPAVVMTGAVALAGIIGQGCQGHSSPKDDMRFRYIHPVVSQSSTTSWALAFASLCLAGPCGSHCEVARSA
jgi:hypothetical protein